VTQPVLIDYSTYAELLAAAIALAVMLKRRQIRDYPYVAHFLLVRAGSVVLETLIWKGVNLFSVNKVAAYEIYFYVYWASYAIEALLCIGIVYSIYKLAMEPLKGLQTLGMIMFRWAGAIAVAVAIGSAFGPNKSVAKVVVAAVSQLQKTQSILTLSLLLFVTFAIRPMGLSYRSKIFGISLGLGLLSTANLISSAWLVQGEDMVSALSLFYLFAILASLVIWTVYFAMPEPRRRMIVLPTTSPFLRWNQISEVLGDSPGYVAVGGLPPELLTSAEIEVMKRASIQMQMKIEPISVMEPVSISK
jgi:hypothetical protein